jgi:hypothetical protein
MAASPYTGVNDNSAPEEQPQDTLRIDASPASFGAPLAQGSEALGAGALDAAKFYNQVSADHATNNYLDARTKILYGDPSQPATDAQGNPILGPDGQPTPDTGYFGRRGADAMAARAGTEKALEEAAREQQSGLSTPASREAFENQSRRFRASDMSSMAQHADQQQKVWATDTNQTSIALGLNSVGQVAADDTASALAGQQVIDAARKNAVIAGEDPRGAELKARQNIALTRIRALSTPQTGAAGAQKAADIFDNSPILASLPNYDQIGRQVKDSVVNYEVGPSVDQFVGSTIADATKAVGTPAGAPGAPSPNSIGNVRNGPNSFAQPATPTDGVILAANNLRNGYRGLTLEQIAQKWAPKGDGANDPAAWAANVSRASGIETTDVPNLDDPGTLKALVGGIGVAEHGQRSASTFTPDIINQGVAASLSGQHANVGTAQGGGQYPSVAAAINAQIPQKVEEARAYAQQRWGAQYPDVPDKYATMVERRLENQVSTITRQYTADTLTVQGVMVGDNAPKSEQELLARGPAVATAWQRMQINDPLKAAGVENMFNNNAKGAAVGFGAGVHDILDGVLAPEGSPNRIADASGLWPHVGPGDGATITNSGANAVSQLIGIRGNPQGESDAAAIKGFLDYQHGALTFSNKGTGMVDEKGERIYSRFVAAALPQLVAAQKAGTLADALNPQSKNYVGTQAASYMRTPAQTRLDRLSYDAPATETRPALTHPLLTGPAFSAATLSQALGALENDRQRSEFLTDAVKSGRLTKQVWLAHLQSIQPPGASTTAPPAPPVPSINLSGQ